MKTRYRTNSFVLSLLCLLMLCLNVSAQEVQPTAVEYWLDTHYDQRVNVPMTGELEQDISVADLCPGIHTLVLRVADSKGRWGMPVLRYFLKPGASLANNVLTRYTYCFDNDWANAVSGEVNGELTLDIDVSSLCEGMHTLQLRVEDSQGHLSQTVLRHFLSFDADPSQRALTSYRYWLDNFDQVVEGFTTDGNISLDIDVSNLCKGIHTISYQVADNTGHLSAPRMSFFLIPDMETGADEVVAYEYWFNHGPRKRVEITPQTEISLDNILIEVKDVLPNRIPDDYVFDVAQERVLCDDEVFFGLQVFNGQERGSLAVLSDTFAMQVPVNPNFLMLNSGEQQTFDAPDTRRVQGLKTNCNAGDSLFYVLSSQSLKADFYDATGIRLETDRTVLETDETMYGMKATTNVCYALLYGASDILTQVKAELIELRPTNIHKSQAGIIVSSRHGQLRIKMPHQGRLTVVSASGMVIIDKNMNAGETTCHVASGIYMVYSEGEPPVKIIVP